MKYTYDYPMFSFASDIVVVDKNLNVLLIERGGEPYKGMLAFPGGFVNINETSLSAAVRELFEETNLSIDSSEFSLLTILDDVNRDPRSRVVSHVYFTVLDSAFEEYNVYAKDDAANHRIKHLSNINPDELAFDHCKILSLVKARLIRM